MSVEQLKIVDSYVLNQSTLFSIKIFLLFFRDGIHIKGRTTLREWNIFNFYVSCICASTVSYFELSLLNSIFYLYIFLTINYLGLSMKRLQDAGNSMYWIFLLLIPIVNIYVLYLLYFKGSILYNKFDNKVFYYEL